MLEGKEALVRLADGNGEHALLPTAHMYTYLRYKAMLLALF